MSGDDLRARVLAEHEAWIRDLEAERVTHSNETHKQLLSRVRRERFTTAIERLRRGQ